MKKIMFMFSILLAVVACSKDEVATKPKLDLSTNSIELNVEGGTKDVTVTSNQKWTAISSAAEWCVVTPASGANNGTLKVVVKANETSTAREAKITVKGDALMQVITVKQKGTDPVADALEVSINSIDFVAEGDTEDVAVTANVDWTATVSEGDAEWCVVTPASGSNNGTLKVEVKANETTIAREAIITVKGGTLEQTITVKQKGTDPVADVLNVSINSIDFFAEGDMEDVAVTANVDWTATVSEGDAEWCVVTPASGSNDGTLKVEVKANETTIAREAIITVKGGTLEQTITVKQKAVSREAFLSGTKWKIISQGGEEMFDNLIGAVINLNVDKTAVIDELEFIIEEGGPILEEITGEWSIDENNNLQISAYIMGAPVEVSFEIEEMTTDVIKCTMKDSMTLLGAGIPIVLNIIKE